MKLQQFCILCSRDTDDDILSDYQWILPCRCREVLGASLVWRWYIPEEVEAAVKLSEDATLVTFHPLNSQGTATVRGTIPLSDDLHYWEVKAVSPTYGTDMMVGVGLVGTEFNYYTAGFCSALGMENNASWGLSYHGDLVHGGLKEHKHLMAFNRGSIVGCLLDLWHGELQFFVDGKTHGYSNLLRLPRASYYPMVCSTASRSGFRLIRTESYTMTLQLLTCRAIRNNHQLRLAIFSRLPPQLKDFLTNHLPWSLYLANQNDSELELPNSFNTNGSTQQIPATESTRLCESPRSSNQDSGSDDPFLWTTFSQPDAQSSLTGSPCLFDDLDSAPVSPMSFSTDFDPLFEASNMEQQEPAFV